MGVTEAFRAIAFSSIRFTVFTANAVVFGLLPVLVLVLRPAFRSAGGPEWVEGRDRLARRIEDLLEAALLTSAVATLLGILLQATVVAGPGGEVSNSAIDAVISTSFGRWYLIRFPLLIGLFVLLSRRIRSAAFAGAGDERRAPVPWLIGWGVLGVGLLATSSFSGHAFAGSPRTLSVANDLCHLVCAATWFTGIIVLAVLLPTVWRGRSEDSVSILAPTVSRFARLAAVVIALIALTGTINSLFDVEHPMDLVESGYGVALMIKIVVFLGILGLGAVNHFYVTRRFEKAEGDTGRVAKLFRKTIALELAFGISVMILTGVLTGLEKTRQSGAVPRSVSSAPRT
ncbi:MAG TPA: CopD family protein [Actinomycetota bacterium]|nr:CopD family protein [Actinomycetota bacterium]